MAISLCWTEAWHGKLLLTVTKSQDGWHWKGLSSPTSLLKQGHLVTAAQDHVQKDLQGWKVRHLLGQPAPVLGHFHSEKAFPHCPGEPLAFQSVPTASGSVTGHHRQKEHSSILFTPPCRYLYALSSTGWLVRPSSQPVLIREML